MNPPPDLISRGSHSKFGAQGPEFLATALAGADCKNEIKLNHCISNKSKLLSNGIIPLICINKSE